MFRFFALFALVAVAAAEPQYYHQFGVHNAAHLKTPSGDTVSVQAAKIQHHNLKAAEYVKKAYIPYSGVVASPVANAVYGVPATYAAGVPATYAAGIHAAGVYSPYGIHHLGKREAEADSQYIYRNAYAASPYVNNVYNNAGVYGGYTGLTGLTGYASPLTHYGYTHHLGKREAESDSQYYTNAYGAHPYNAYNTAQVYGRYSGYTGFPYTTTYGNVMNRFHY
jgi:hypothetical protein